MRRTLEPLLRNTSGATAVEYGVLASIMAVAVLTCINLYGDAFKGLVDYLVESMVVVPED